MDLEKLQLTLLILDASYTFVLYYVHYEYIYLSFSFYYFEVHLILVYHVVFILLWFLTEHAPVSLFVLVIEFLFLLFYLFSNNVV